MSAVLEFLATPFRFLVDLVYLAAHRGEIFREREEYRRQIKDREQWAATMLENKDALHRIEMERITAELGRVITARTEVAERALTILERTAEARTEYDAAIDALRTRWKTTLGDLLDATTLLAMMLSFEPRERRQRALTLLTPAMAAITNEMVERIEASGEHPDFATLRLQTLREIVGRWQELR